MTENGQSKFVKCGISFLLKDVDFNNKLKFTFVCFQDSKEEV
jgi:hypothetical protein